MRRRREDPTARHRVTGAALAVLGLALLAGQLLALYGYAEREGLSGDIGLPGVAVFTALGAVSFSVGFMLAAAPRATVRHLRRAAGAVRRRSRV